MVCIKCRKKEHGICKAIQLILGESHCDCQHRETMINLVVKAPGS